MGLYKEIEASNGVPLSYHRIVSINIIVNNQNIIEVASYVSQKKRTDERLSMLMLQKGNRDAIVDAFIETQYINTDYDPDITIESAYGMLKEMEQFEGAEDVFDDPVVEYDDLDVYPPEIEQEPVEEKKEEAKK